jgi:hypothetical protein
MTATTNADGFEFPELPLNTAPDGVSILLTGDDTDALERVFYHLITARKGERSLVLAPETSGQTVNQALDGVVSGASTRSTVISCEGVTEESNADTIGAIPTLSSAGMQFSALLTESGTVAAPQRAGLLLSSKICQSVTDSESVSHFVQANFLTHLRRSRIMGVCGIDTSYSLAEERAPAVEEMAAAFSVHLRVERGEEKTVIIHITGPNRCDEMVSVELPAVMSREPPNIGFNNRTGCVEVGD